MCGRERAAQREKEAMSSGVMLWWHSCHPRYYVTESDVKRRDVVVASRREEEEAARRERAALGDSGGRCSVNGHNGGWRGLGLGLRVCGFGVWGLECGGLSVIDSI